MSHENNSITQQTLQVMESNAKIMESICKAYTKAHHDAEADQLSAYIDEAMTTHKNLLRIWGGLE